MSNLEPYSDNGQIPLPPKDQPPRKRESFDLLKPNSETYQCVSQEASLYIGLIEQCDEEGRQPSERDYKRLAPELVVRFKGLRLPQAQESGYAHFPTPIQARRLGSLSEQSRALFALFGLWIIAMDCST
jgi:hypothetical protein